MYNLRIPSTLLRFFLIFLVAGLGTLAAFSVLSTTTVHAMQTRTAPTQHPTHTGPLFSRSVVNTPARSFDPKISHSSKASVNVPLVNGLGNVGFYDYYSSTINKRIQLKVNVASGNLLVQTSDLSIHGTGIDLSIGSTYNSLGNHFAQHGQGWTLNFGSDVALQSNSDGSKTFFDPTGHQWTFLSNGSGGWTTPPGLNADLASASNNTFTLTFHSSAEVYTFNSSAILVKDTDKNQNSITFNTDASNPSQIDSITDTQGRTTSVSHDSQGRVTQITDSLQRSILYSYNAGNQLSSITDQAGNITQFSYTNGLLTEITDPVGNTTNIAYDSNSLVGIISDPLFNETSFGYFDSSASQCTAIKNNTNPCTVLTDGNNHNTTYAYDTNFKVSQVQDAVGNLTSRTYTSNNNVQNYTDGLLDQSVFSFSTDGHNNLQSVTDGNGSKTQFGYTDPNHPFSSTTLTDAQNHQTNTTYDTNGNVTKTQDMTPNGTGVTVSYAYNSNNGTLASETDGRGNVTNFAYDSKGNMIKVIFANPGPTANPLEPQELAYDTISRVTSLTDGDNHQTTYLYDNLDQVKKVTYNDGTSVSYTYDGNGNITSLTDHTGTTAYTYDADNRQITKTLPDGTTISTTFDSVGNLTSLSTLGGTTTYAYNPVNLLSSLSEPSGATTTFTYDAAYHRTKTKYPNGVSLNTTYDKAGQITAISGTNGSTTLTSYTYTYTPNNLRQQVVDQTNTKTTYSYDSLNRLTNADIFSSAGTHDNSFIYRYDAAGNRTSYTQGTTSPTTITYNYNADNELTSKSGTPPSNSVIYNYDNNGNVTNWSSGPPITYNLANQMTAFGSTTFNYSGPDQNQRVQVNNTNFVYSGLGNDSESTSAGTTFYTHDSSGQLIDERTPTGTYYYLFDGLGSIVGLTDSTGALVGNETYHYDPYGQLIRPLRSAPLQVNAWRFAGGFFDMSTGLYKFGVRYYDPNIGRWTQRDPVGGSLTETTTANPYAYGGDNPVNMVDPSGHIAVVVAALVLIGIGAVVGALGNLWALGATNPNASEHDIGQALFAGAISGGATAAAALLFLNPISLSIDSIGGISLTSLIGSVALGYGNRIYNAIFGS